MVKGSATNSEEINDKIKCKCREREGVGCGGGTREIGDGWKQMRAEGGGETEGERGREK